MNEDTTEMPGTVEAPTYRDLFTYFPLVEAFAQRDLPRSLRLNMAVRLMKLRDLYRATEVERRRVVQEYVMRDDEGNPVHQDGSAVFENREEFDAALSDVFDVPIEDFPRFPRQIRVEELPDDVSPIEVEALVRLGQLELRGIWD